MSRETVVKTYSEISQIWYLCVRKCLTTVMISVCGVRASGRKHIPESGPTLLVSNHASYYDTIVLGVVQNRMIDFMARSGLFIPVLGHFIRSMGAFPIQRDGGGAAGIKETLKRLKSAHLIGLFPEGTRTGDGHLQPLRPGIASIARKSSSSIQCAGISGAFEAWPRWQPWPGAYQIHVHYVSTLKPDILKNMTEEQILEQMQAQLQEALGIAQKETARLRDYQLF